MMTEMLLAKIGRQANSAAAEERQIRLATAVLLCSALPGGDAASALNAPSLREELNRLFALPRSRLDRLIINAGSAPQSRPTILACADLLKLRSSVGFRQDVVASAIRIGLADTTINHFELHLIERLSRLLNVSPAGERHAA